MAVTMVVTVEQQWWTISQAEAVALAKPAFSSELLK